MPPSSFTPMRSTFLLLTVLLLLRGFFWLATFPNPDEAYYWLWGQHPGLSYYDHPPFHAWVQGLFSAVLGSSYLTLRLPNLISNGIFFYTYYWLVRDLYGEKSQPIFWLVVLLVLTSPLYFLFLALAWQDHWLITSSLVAMACFIRFLDGYLHDGRGKSWQLYAAGGAIALALLCKYNAVFVPLGFLAALVADRRLRPLLRDARLYAAAAIALTALVPIGLWNATHDWQSFRYYMNRSVSTGSFYLRFDSALGFLLISILTVSPFYAWGFWRIWQRRRMLDSVYATVAFWIFAVSTGILTTIALVSTALYYWNITAYLLLFPLLPAIFQNGDRPDSSPKPWTPALGYGMLFAVLLVVHYSVLPLSALVSRDADPDSRMLFGWEAVAATVRQQQELGSHPALMTTDYRSASALAYQLGDRDVTAISPRIDQFDFWKNPNLTPGNTAVIVSDEWHPLSDEIRQRFRRLSETTIVPIQKWGIWIKNYSIQKGYDYRP